MKKYLIKDLAVDFSHMNFNWIQHVSVITDRIKKPWNFVGGCVRDSLLGISTYDIDINTTADPDDIETFMVGFNISIVGKRFGTIGVFYKGWKIEITTTREDVTTYGRKADVEFVNNFAVDSNRRDFTINALMLHNNEITDYHNGIQDLKNRNIRFINDPEQRIQEDYLRIMRYIRFLCRFSDGNQYIHYAEIIKNNLNGLKIVSIERIISEIYAMCKHNNTNKAIQIMNLFGISKLIFEQNLNENINDEWLVDKKMTFIFINFAKFQWKKLPLMKIVKYYLEVKDPPYHSILENFAYIWSRYHSLDRAYDFLDIYNSIHNTSEVIVVQEFNKTDYDFLDSFTDKSRALAAFYIKLLHLKNEKITIEKIQQLVETTQMQTN
jgi:hypothetical protein